MPLAIPGPSAFWDPADLTAEGTVPEGVGCDPTLWYGARTWLYVTYGVAGGACVIACVVVCCVTACVAASGRNDAKV